jgi:hypothetical protein
MSKKKASDDEWRSSSGKKLLVDDVRKGRIAASMHWKTAFQMRPEFVMPSNDPAKAESLFYNRLRAVRRQVAEKNSRAATELALMNDDRKIRPKPCKNHRGEPRWEGSLAQEHLKSDVKAGKHNGLTAEQFHSSRPEYQQYPRSIIWEHVAQEIRLTKFLKQYGDRRR